MMSRRKVLAALPATGLVMVLPVLPADVFSAEVLANKMVRDFKVATDGQRSTFIKSLRSDGFLEIADLFEIVAKQIEVVAREL